MHPLSDLRKLGDGAVHLSLKCRNVRQRGRTTEHSDFLSIQPGIPLLQDFLLRRQEQVSPGDSIMQLLTDFVGTHVVKATLAS